MDSNKLTSVLLILTIFISTTPPLILSCGYCPPNKPLHPPKTTPPKYHPPTTNPPKGPIVLPPIIGKPPVTLPPIIGKPPVIVPPFIGNPPVVTPPVIGNPPIIGNPPPTGTAPCPPGGGSTTPTTPPAGPATCPIDTLKLGACVDLLGGLVHIGLGDPVVNQCCPLLQGLVELEAAVCLCTTIRLRLLNINIYLPIALQLLITCGLTPPPGYTCTI